MLASEHPRLSSHIPSASMPSSTRQIQRVPLLLIVSTVSPGLYSVNGPATMVRLFSFHLMPKGSIALVMDKICGWEDEEKWVGSKFAACMWIYTKGCVDKWAKTHSRNVGVLEATLLPIMLCMNWSVLERSTITSWCPQSQLPSKEKK